MPSRTSSAPIHKTPTIPAKTSAMMITVIAARVRMRTIATSKDFSVTSLNFVVERLSWVNACTVCAALNASEALPLLTAIQSWFSRLNRRNRRPSTMIGTTTAGTSNNTSPVSLAEVSANSTKPPNSINTLRNATDTDEPMID